MTSSHLEHQIEGKHDLTYTGDVYELTCPKCHAVTYRAIVGCADCLRVATLAYAAHLAACHPEFIQTAKAAQAAQS